MKTLKIKLPFKLKKTVLALGPQTKNTICFAKGDIAHISRLHADLSVPEDLLTFEKDARLFLKMRPKIIAYDLHPEYQSTKFASQLRVRQSACRQGLKFAAIQHHHAHIASCMAENGLKNQKVIGVAFDGTGLGSDNTIWGAEFLVCDYKNFRRQAHLKEIALVGGEKAILEPGRVLAAWLNFDKSIDKGKVLKKIYSSGINSPLASSMGRLFDAVGSLVMGKKEAKFEAELAIALEKLASKNNSEEEGYKFNLIKDKNSYILDPAGIFKQIIQDLKTKVLSRAISRRFHQSVAEMILQTALFLSKKHRINRVVLSGGVFQNKILLKISLDLLYKRGFQVFTQQHLSCNDAGIALGQAVISGYRG